MKLCIFGAGAIGGLMAAKLAAKGEVDVTVIARGPHLAAMQKIIAGVLHVDPDLVNVKVKSGEGLDAVGREEAVAAQAVCLIERA